VITDFYEKSDEQRERILSQNVFWYESLLNEYLDLARLNLKLKNYFEFGQLLGTLAKVALTDN
jgi:hypothetical protein